MIVGIYGLIGEHLSHSLSQIIHKKLFSKTGFSAAYNLFQVKREHLKDVIPSLKALGIKGVNVTIPYKIDIIKYLDDTSSEAEKIGAVNTIAIFDNRAIGDNTDYFGFGMTLRKHGVQLKGKKAVILGTGGAARAVYQYLVDNGVREIIFASSDPKKARQYYKNLNIISYHQVSSIDEGDILVNCTPVGMYPNMQGSPVDASYLYKFGVVVDLIYNPRETVLLKNTRKAGSTAIDGLYMLVCQAAKAQELWNQTSIDLDIIDRTYLEVDKVMSHGEKKN